jgi:DNA-binding protein H-NS
MESLSDLIQQREAIEAKIRQVRLEQTAEAIGTVRRLIAEYDLTEADLFGTSRKRVGAGASKVTPKYRNPETGDTWTGRGKPPRWIQDKNREDYLIPVA